MSALIKTPVERAIGDLNDHVRIGVIDEGCSIELDT